jgi:predicted XRE-type DNA-binding protein
MTTDTSVRHVTKPGANLFRELGFSPAEAKRLHARSKRQIDDTKALKEQLMLELSKWIAENHLRQIDAAQILMISRPRVSDVVNMKSSKFTIDALVGMMSCAGKPVRLAVG